MKIRYQFVIAVAAVLFASNAKADIVGSTYNFSTSTTGGVQIAGSPAGTYHDPANPGFCIGPPTSCAQGSGVSGSFAFADQTPTSSTITFTFFGSSNGSAGSFSIDLGNFVTLDGDKVTNVTYTSGNMTGFNTVTFDGTTAIFTGTTSGGFDAVGGRTAVFTVTESPVPEPGSLLMVGTGLVGLGGLLRRKLTL